MNTPVSIPLVTLSYLLQFAGFIFVSLAWWKAFFELRRGTRLYSTRLLMFVITSVTLMAYLVPVVIAACYFREGCFQPIYRDYSRLFSGLILFLYGLFKFLLYYTKERDI